MRKTGQTGLLKGNFIYGLEIRTSSNLNLIALLIRKLTTKLIPIRVGQFLILSIMVPTVWIIKPGVLCNGINC